MKRLSVLSALTCSNEAFYYLSIDLCFPILLYIAKINQKWKLLSRLVSKHISFQASGCTIYLGYLRLASTRHTTVAAELGIDFSCT
eukprot:6490094-Amphidinium_carterae.1